MASPEFGLSGTVRAVVDDLRDEPVTAGEVATRFLRLRDDYADHHAGSFTVSWPEPDDPATAKLPMSRWLPEVARYLHPAARGVLTGRRVIIGLGLADGPTGRALERSGLGYALAVEERIPPLRDRLTEAGTRLIGRRMPLVAATLGLPVVVATREGPDAASEIAFPRDAGRLAPDRYAAAWGGRVEIVRGDVVEFSGGLLAARLAWQRETLFVLDAGGKLFAVRRSDRGWNAEPVPVPGNASVDRVAAGDSGVAVLADGRVRWAAETTDLDGGHVVPASGATDIALNDLADRLAVVADGTVELWRAGDTAPLYTAPGVKVAVGRGRLVAAERGQLIVSGEPDFAAVLQPPGEVGVIAAGPDGLVAAGIVEAGPGASVLVWIDEVLVGRFAVPAPPNRLQFSRDGAVLGVAGGDNVVRIFRLRPAASDLVLGGYTSDDTGGRDLLQITTRVDALAAVMAARVVEPPLSVGLFGPWGSGKTFFMQRLREKVDEITLDARTAGRRQCDLWTYKNVAQVWFNAWNYAAGDVWAGLVEHLLSELSRGGLRPLDSGDELERMRLDRLNALAAARSQYEQLREELEAAETERANANRALTEAQQALDAVRDEADDAERKLDRATAVVSKQAKDTAVAALEPFGLRPVGESVREVSTALREAQATALKVQAVVIPLFRAEDAGKRRRWLLLALVAGPLFALVAGVVAAVFRPQLAGVVATATGLAAGLAAAARWVTTQASWLGQQVDGLVAAEKAISDDIVAKEQEVAEKRQQLAETAAAYEKQQKAADQAEQAAAAAAEEVERSTPTRLLADYIADRAASEDYRAHLGILGRVRRDFEVISTAVGKHNDALAEGRSDDDDALNRVVLYVDDLDRCPPDVVVRVLEAVHLLMSFRLFVVVVGVDPQWVARALRITYPDLLTGGEVSPDDYLEKIFQIPVWLDPLRPETTRRMVRGLVGSEDRPVSVQAGAAPLRSQAGGGAVPAPASSTQVAAPSVRENKAVDPPASLTINDEEVEAILQLAPLLLRSPRALKRYLNTYRMLKAEVSDRDDLEMVRFLLAVAIARAGEGTELLAALATRPDAALGDLADGLRAAGRHALTNRLAELPDPGWRNWRCARLVDLAAAINRYLLRSR